MYYKKINKKNPPSPSFYVSSTTSTYPHFDQACKSAELKKLGNMLYLYCTENENFSVMYCNENENLYLKLFVFIHSQYIFWTVESHLNVKSDCSRWADSNETDSTDRFISDSPRGSAGHLIAAETGCSPCQVFDLRGLIGLIWNNMGLTPMLSARHPAPRAVLSWHLLNYCPSPTPPARTLPLPFCLSPHHFLSVGPDT